MGNDKVFAGFIGAGSIARSHAFALNSLKYYYNDAPEIELTAVCSATEKSRKPFAERYGFIKSCSPDDFIADDRIDTVFILGPNNVHYEHFRAAIGMKAIKRIYLEKPVCSNPDEEASIRKLARSNPGIRIQVGFQYLFSPAVREALSLWKSGIMGNPVHFELKYYHSDYLKKEYRDKRATRLTPAPDGGAMADLGSHAISFLTAFLGENLQITGALQGGNFEDVNEESDLFSQISLYDRATGAVGTVSASRISSGTGDDLSVELYADKGSLRYSTASPEYFGYYLAESGIWSKKVTGSEYKHVTSFPSGHVPPGWHRSMVHAHYVFLTGSTNEPFIPDIEHGLQVQRLVRETAEHLEKFREISHLR
jgi:predicted dehydrogenase